MLHTCRTTSTSSVVTGAANIIGAKARANVRRKVLIYILKRDNNIKFDIIVSKFLSF
jgi:hypothetical protein